MEEINDPLYEYKNAIKTGLNHAQSTIQRMSRSGLDSYKEVLKNLVFGDTVYGEDGRPAGRENGLIGTNGLLWGKPKDPTIQTYKFPFPPPEDRVTYIPANTSTPTPTQSYTPTVTPTATPSLAQQYSPTANPSQGATPQDQASWDFPVNDKPQVPPKYRESIIKAIGDKKIPSLGPVVASVLGQETGGYGYGFIDPRTGKVNEDWSEAKRLGIRGDAGEVGVAQIVPKWHWKAAGFPDRESYAQALYDPDFAIQEATRILSHAYEIYGDWEKALATWNKAPSYPREVLGRIGILGGD